MRKLTPEEKIISEERKKQRRKEYYLENKEKRNTPEWKKKRAKSSKKSYEKKKNDPEYIRKKAEYNKYFREKNDKTIKEKKAKYFQDTKYSEEHFKKRQENSHRQALKVRFGMTPEQYDKLLNDQDGVCAICGEFKISAQQSRMGVDHNHNTLKIRGILCDWCNIGIGRFNDDIGLLQKAIDYIKEDGKNVDIGEVMDVKQFNYYKRVVLPKLEIKDANNIQTEELSLAGTMEPIL